MSWTLAAAVAVAAFFIPPSSHSVDTLQLSWLMTPGRYFVPAAEGKLTTNPELVRLDNPPETFAPRKEPGRTRIFCVGGSTTRGWPFHRVTSYPKMLAQALGPKYEVLNAGFMRSDSWSDRALVEQLLAYQPDLILLYAGRNERWDYPMQAGRKGTLLRLHLRLMRRSRLYAAAYGGAKRTPGSNIGQGVREWAARGVEVEDGGLKDALLSNLRAAEAAARGRGVKLLVLTQVTHDDDEEVSRLNGWLRQSGLTLLEVDEAFAGRRQELVMPRPAVHPDLEGYALMARTVASGLEKLGYGPARPVAAPALEADYRKEVYCRVGRLFVAVGSPARVSEGYFRKAGPGPCPSM